MTSYPRHTRTNGNKICEKIKRKNQKSQKTTTCSDLIRERKAHCLVTQLAHMKAGMMFCKLDSPSHNINQRKTKGLMRKRMEMNCRELSRRRQTQLKASQNSHFLHCRGFHSFRFLPFHFLPSHFHYLHLRFHFFLVPLLCFHVRFQVPSRFLPSVLNVTATVTLRPCRCCSFHPCHRHHCHHSFLHHHHQILGL